MDSATVSVTATQRGNGTLSYVFNGKEQSSNEIKMAAKDNGLTITIKSDDGFTVDLEPVDFAWASPTIVEQHSAGDYRNGQKGAIVELFGWPHKDVEKECAFLAEARP